MKEFYMKATRFGFKIAIYLFLSKLFNHVLPHKKITTNITNKKNDAILKYLLKNYGYIVEKCKRHNRNEVKKNNIIWIFWWQGLMNAPFLVRKCIESIKLYYPEYEINIIDKRNLSDYLKIDTLIMEKVKSGKITYTHFSDIIRMKLLRLYGGIWMDATIFITEKVDLGADLVTLHLCETDENNKMISKGKWCGFFLGGTSNYIYQFVDDFFEEYWKKEEELIDYFLIDYVIEIGYRNIAIITKLIDDVPYNNIDVFKLQHYLNEDYDDEIYKKICKNTKVHKLSYKDVLYTDRDNTFYRKLFCSIRS